MNLHRSLTVSKICKCEFIHCNVWPLCVNARVSMYLYKALVPISVYRTVLSYKKLCMYYVHKNRYTLYQYNIDMTSHTFVIVCLHTGIPFFSKRSKRLQKCEAKFQFCPSLKTRIVSCPWSSSTDNLCSYFLSE